MSLAVGIVGLPNVGKSTLFNALTRTQQAAAANYPFCTIEANQATVPVPDKRLPVLAKLCKPQRIVSATVDFVDIAGLVRGASRGDGLGNQFLARIREVSAIIHMVRCFECSDVVHVEGGVDPLRDVEIIETELLLADLQLVERRLERMARMARVDPAIRPALAVVERVRQHLDSGHAARLFETGSDVAAAQVVTELQLLTAKPIIYCANLGEEDLMETAAGESEALAALRGHAARKGAALLTLAAQLEAELAVLADAEREGLLAEYGLRESGLDQTIRLAYETLGLISYFTQGPSELHAWTVKYGTLAPAAAGEIHSDFERGFIRAEVVAYDEFVKHGSEQACRAAATLRLEGKEYMVQDGDVIHFLFNV